MPLIRQVALPAYAQIQKDRSKFNYYFLKSQRLAFLLFAPIFWGIAATSQQLVPAVFGDKWEAASAVLTAYCIMMPFRTSHELFNPALKTLDKVRILISNEILILTVMCPLFYLLGEKGPLGLAFAWLTGYAFCFCIIAYRCCKALDVKLKEYGLSIYIPILAGMGMFICVYFTGQRMEALSISALATVGTQIVVGVITYVGLLTLLGKHLIKELLSLRK
jgi:O-antigen/teichoic acid export membrane protein